MRGMPGKRLPQLWLSDDRRYNMSIASRQHVSDALHSVGAPEPLAYLPCGLNYKGSYKHAIPLSTGPSQLSCLLACLLEGRLGSGTQ